MKPRLPSVASYRKIDDYTIKLYTSADKADVFGYHRLRTRKSGHTRFVEFHLLTKGREGGFVFIAEKSSASAFLPISNAEGGQGRAGAAPCRKRASVGRCRPPDRRRSWLSAQTGTC